MSTHSRMLRIFTKKSSKAMMAMTVSVAIAASLMISDVRIAGGRCGWVSFKPLSSPVSRPCIRRRAQRIIERRSRGRPCLAPRTRGPIAQLVRAADS